jgi:hypothetical protein
LLGFLKECSLKTLLSPSIIRIVRVFKRILETLLYPGLLGLLGFVKERSLETLLSPWMKPGRALSRTIWVTRIYCGRSNY